MTAFQERSLSRRCLFFTREEVLFHCADFEAREAYRVVSHGTSNRTSIEGEKSAVRRRGQDFNDRICARKALEYHDYGSAVAQYSMRELTYPGDRLDAFSGILDKY